ncbi:zinc-binding alcohol dehydrogenase family protein [Halotalea alkalilenta]|uniref:zinc-binding alcohol dehydrogenase family protein n=1 Tax=Halotalea alkalilenta TaxID=376489 RepID=UPI000484FF40|nr:zinc-binding alcohol dehydrogenase family protein [Halotalea alkalilenta]
MKAIGYRAPGAADVLEALELPDPIPGEHDLLVEVKAVSVNPIDTKVRARPGSASEEAPKVLGWDVAGVVKAVGAKVEGFAPGERVWYAGAVDRPGANSELHVVDARIAGHMPASLDFAQAVALPLTSITAWELLFDRLEVQRADPLEDPRLLVIGAAGGVGSILIQLARQLSSLEVIGTASRAETRDWLTGLGAHRVVDHSRPLDQALAEQGIDRIDYVIGLNHTDQHLEAITKLIAPQGKFALIDDPAELDIRPLKYKSVSVHWETMFTRSLYQTADIGQQRRLLEKLARLVDAGRVRTTFAEHYGRISVDNLVRAHRFIESGKARGKVVLEGF